MQSRKSSHLVSVALAFMAVSCLLIMTLVVVIAAASTPNYSHLSQFISELGATDAPFAGIVRFAGFLPVGLLLCVFTVLAHRVLPQSRAVTFSLFGLALYAVGYLVAAVFPCDPGCRPSEPSTSQIIHNVGGLIGYLLSPMFLFALARAARHWPGATRLSIVGYFASAVALLGVLTLSPSSSLVGLSQRLLETAVLAWVAMLGIYIARNGAISTDT